MVTKKNIAKKPKAIKGNMKVKSDKDTENNPLLKIDETNAAAFTIEVNNILNDPNVLTLNGYENFNPMDVNTLAESKDGKHKLAGDSNIIVILLYYEYVIMARFNVSYIMPLWLAGKNTGDFDFDWIIQSVCHRLKNELSLRAPNFDVINELDIKYLYKIKFI